MMTQCDHAKLRDIGEADVIEHFHLPQCHISSLPEGVPSRRHLDQYVVSVNVAESAEFIRSKFVRLSRVSIPNFKGSQLKFLRELCEAAHRSKGFFLTVARNQWLRTTISGRDSVNLFTSTEEERQRCTDIHSNVFPYDSYWRRPLGNESSSREHFPCHILKEADDQTQTLSRKLIEWRLEDVGGEECDIRKHEEDDERVPLKKFWEVQDEAVTAKVSEAQSVSQVTWRGGTFVKKYVNLPAEFDAEVNAMEKLCHPHIVYIFGINVCNKEQGSSLYMECMDSDLLDLILDKDRQPEGGDNGPPFSQYNSVDMLLQIAKGMAHMHQNEVIHGDFKTPNVLVSKFKISENQFRYLAKVADFGSSQMKVSTGFRPAEGTTIYAAPEVLRFRQNQNIMEIPAELECIDVYSFGLVAFEVLTGMNMKRFYEGKTRTEVKKGVMNGTLKPPLRDECRKDKFLYINSLMSLIERCWDTGTSERPPQRPLFPEIVQVLSDIRDEIWEPEHPLAAILPEHPPAAIPPEHPPAAIPLEQPYAATPAEHPSAAMHPKHPYAAPPQDQVPLTYFVTVEHNRRTLDERCMSFG